MRRLALAMTFGLAAFAAAQEAAQKVTYTTRAATADHVVAELAVATKMNLSVAPSMANEVLVISVKGVPVNDLLARIATATAGSWTQDGQTLKLVSNDAVRNREAKAELAQRVLAIKKEIVERMKPHKAYDMPSDEDAPPDPKAKPKKPVPEVVDDEAQVLGHLDPEALAALGDNDRVVFSTRPTRAQRPFVGDVSAVINRIIQKHNAELASGVGAPDSDDDDEVTSLPPAFKSLMAQRNKPIGAVFKAIAVASKMGMGMGNGMMQIELRLYDADGKVVYTTQIGLNGSMLGAEAEAESKPETPLPAGPQTPIEISSTTKAFADAFKGMEGGPRNFKLTSEVRYLVYHPDKIDPLSLFTTDALLATAKKHELPLVASVPDNAISMMSMFGGSKKNATVEGFEKELASDGAMQASVAEGWLLIRPSKPASARERRVDRAALTALMKAVDEKGAPNLDDLAAFSLHAPPPIMTDEGLTTMYMAIFVPGSMLTGMMKPSNWDMLRFYGSLPPQMKSGFSNGGRINLGALNGYQQGLLRQMVYGASPSLEPADSKPAEDDGGLFGFMSSVLNMGLGGGDYRNEPTEALPDGIPGNGFMEVVPTTEPVATPVAKEGESVIGIFGVLDADTLAMLKVFKDQTNGELAGAFPSYDQLRIGRRTVYKFTFRFTPQLLMRQSLNDDQLPKDGAVVSMANLPPDFQKLVAAKLEKLKKSPFGAISSGGGVDTRTIKP